MIIDCHTHVFQVQRHCDFLTAREKELMLGGNVADLCGIGRPGA